MSYPPPRPPMGMPGMPPLGTLMAPPGYTLPGMGTLGPMTMGMISGPMMTPVAMGLPMAMAMPSLRPIIKSAPPTTYKKPEHQVVIAKGPTVTVFIGNISDKIGDNLVRQILQKCGTVINWKRVQGSDGKLQAFGFCEYGDTEAAIKAIRILHDWDVKGKRLVVKVDAKTKLSLDEYLASKRSSAEFNEAFLKKEDEVTKSFVSEILKSNSDDFDSSPPVEAESYRNVKLERGDPYEAYLIRDDLDEMGLEEDRKNLIHREIDKFRDTYKRAEEEKGRERKEKDSKDKDPNSSGKSISTTSVIKKSRDRDHSSRNSRASERTRERPRNRTPDTRVSDRSASRERSREISREKEWEPKEKKEDEDDIYDRKKIDRKLREKEASYKERLRNWEIREKKKAKEYEKEKLKEENRKKDEQRETKRLKEFLEDYDDERDDPKFYKGSALARRIKDREKEIDADYRDRQKEKEELEELRRKLAEDGHPDIESELKRIHKEEEEKYFPSVAHMEIDVESDKESEKMDTQPVSDHQPPHQDENTQNSMSGFSQIESPIKEESKLLGFAGIKLGSSPQVTINATSNNNHNVVQKKKMSVEEAFNDNDEESQKKKRALIPLKDDKPSYPNTVSVDDKRKHIKTLIENIPTEKDVLFAYEVDWSVVDNSLMERRIRPWINKKIIEYIGEEEKTLVDFICTKVMNGSSAQSILNDVLMVLDEEAEVFVVKMWRLLIYEIEAKKVGLVK